MTDQSLWPPCDSEERQTYEQKVLAWNQMHQAECGKPRRVYILTFGCQQNVADSEKLAGMARAMGYGMTDQPEAADLILVNTCAIREHAEVKALSIVGQYKHLRAQKPELLIGLCGCMVTQPRRVEEIKERYPYVNFVLGTASLHRLPQMVWETLQKRRRLYCVSDDASVFEGIPVQRASSYRAWTSIMYGCNNFCSYCIVPYVRGRERSRDRRQVISEVRDLVAQGYRDITLLGQNVNSYSGGSGEDAYDFADLLRELDDIPGDYWLRFMTSHPKDAAPKLMEVMGRGRHIAHQFHLPMQSGSDAILRAMNRRYDRAHYMEIVTQMRRAMPDVALSSDVIVGFPGETEEDFEATLDMLHLMRFDQVYSFIYSPRKGTPAAEMPPLSEDVKGRRFRRLLEVQEEIAQEAAQRAVGQVMKVLCDGASQNKRYPDWSCGRNEGNKTVFFKAAPQLQGRFVSVRIQRASPAALWGECVPND